MSMKVKTLIKLLQKQHPDSRVFMPRDSYCVAEHDFHWSTVAKVKTDDIHDSEDLGKVHAYGATLLYIK